MKINGRARLITAHIIIAFIAITASYFYLGNIINSNTAFSANNKARLLVNGVLIQLENNYEKLLGNENIASIINPLLDEINSSLEIIDTSGFLLYSSEGYDHNSKIVDLKSYIYDFKYLEANKTGRFTFPIVIEGQQVANAVFNIPIHLVRNITPSHAVILALQPVVILLILVLIVMVIVRKGLTRKYIQPIDELNNSIREIIQGNYDRQIKYIDNGEIGNLCNSIDFLRKELKDLKESQETQRKSQKELITNISHDLKTPIASIKAYVHGLKEGVANNPQMVERYLAVIDKKSDSLVTLIDDLLQHSIKELGQLSINKKEDYSKALFEKILEPITVQFENSPVNFFIERELPDVLINVDAIRLEQIIVNLVQNARKYTENGGSITFSAENSEKHIKVTIKDTGYGVTPEELPYIFDSFYRGERFRNRDFDGAGLGLSICKYIVEKHGGTIEVSSKLNEGSTFMFTIEKI